MQRQLGGAASPIHVRLTRYLAPVFQRDLKCQRFFFFPFCLGPLDTLPPVRHPKEACSCRGGRGGPGNAVTRLRPKTCR